MTLYDAGLSDYKAQYYSYGFVRLHRLMFSQFCSGIVACRLYAFCKGCAFQMFFLVPVMLKIAEEKGNLPAAEINILSK